jgi:putative transposase
VDSASPSYKGHRYPVEIIAHRVWLYFRFPLGFHEVEEPVLERGVLVPHETVRRWCAKFGQTYANGLRRRRPDPGTNNTWTRSSSKPTESRSTCGGPWTPTAPSWTSWSSIGGTPLRSRFLRQLLKKTCSVPRVLVTDKPRSYSVARREVMPCVEHRAHMGLNNRAEKSHRPIRQRERAVKGFQLRRRSPAVPVRVQRHLPPFRPHRHLTTASGHRTEMTIRFAIWDRITGASDRSTTA